LSEIAEILPAGTYDIETDEQMIEGNENTVFVRMARRPRVDSGGTWRTLTIVRTVSLQLWRTSAFRPALLASRLVQNPGGG